MSIWYVGLYRDHEARTAVNVLVGHLCSHTSQPPLLLLLLQMPLSGLNELDCTCPASSGPCTDAKAFPESCRAPAPFPPASKLELCSFLNYSAVI